MLGEDGVVSTPAKGPRIVAGLFALIEIYEVEFRSELSEKLAD